MARWPDVPAVYGWLALDRRGNWRIKGERVANPVVSAYIGRNYTRDEAGRWFFQNGPQRVFVTLEYAPYVYRVGPAPALETHNGKPVDAVSGAWIDDRGSLLLATAHGVGVVDDRDLGRTFPLLIDARGNPFDDARIADLLDLLQQGRPAPLWLRFGNDSVRVEPIRSDDVPERFGFVVEPAPSGGHEVCSNRVRSG